MQDISIFQFVLISFQSVPDHQHLIRLALTTVSVSLMSLALHSPLPISETWLYSCLLLVSPNKIIRTQPIPWHLPTYMFRYRVPRYDKKQRTKKIPWCTPTLFFNFPMLPMPLLSSSPKSLILHILISQVIPFLPQLPFPHTPVNKLSWRSIKSLSQIHKDPVSLVVSFQSLLLHLSQYEHNCTSPWSETKLFIM